MKSPISTSGRVLRARAAMSRHLFLWCIVVTFLALASAGAQTSQPDAAKTQKTAKKTKSTHPKQTAKKKSSEQQQLTASTNGARGLARKKQAEDNLSEAEEVGKFDILNRAAREAYEARAYPAAYIPQAVTEASYHSWVGFKNQDAKRPKAPNETPKPWTFYPLSTQEFPQVLSFSGRPYFDSGRITALAIASTCMPGNCRLWVGAAGGGIWRTDDAMAATPAWTFVSTSFATNAIGTLTYDASSGTLYAGTGEANASADSEAGWGIYKSIDGGTTWTQLASNTTVAAGSVDCTAVVGVGGIQTAPAYSGAAFNGRAISSIVIDGGTMYVGSTRAVRGVIAVTSGGAVSLAPGLPPYGIWKSTDGGATFTLLEVETACLNPTLAGAAGIIQTSFGSTRGVNHIEVDPSDPNTVYAAAFPRTNALPVNTGGGVWRSNDGGTTWTQIQPALNPTQNTDRAEFGVTTLPNTGKTRMYVYDGNAGTDVAQFYRSDDVASGSPVFTNMTTAQNAGICTSQCWYDNFAITPKGYPDTVYLGGSFDYGNYGFTNDGRGVIYSTDGGNSFTDMTWDANFKPTPVGSCCQPNPIAPNGIHPDQHALVVSPTNPALFFEGSDGGLMRSSGSTTNISSQCAARGLTGPSLTTCQQLLSRVPSTLYSLNKGLSTLQFQGISVDPLNVRYVQGGTQDNGTWIANWSAGIFAQEIYGDGGQSGFSATNDALRFNSFTGNFSDGNFQNGDPTKWVILTGPIVASGEGAQFYAPVIADPSPAAAQTIFQGSNSVWRTQDWGGNQAFLEANCSEFTTSGGNPVCGDFVPLGPTGKTSLTASNAADYRGTTRSGGNVANIARTTSDTSTMWAATTTGRVFISKNADNPTASAVVYARLDSMPSATASPGRFVSGIFVDPKNANAAWISYSSYSSLTPTTPGHVFYVKYDPTANGGLGDATWTSLDGSGSTAFPDFPATAVAWDPLFGLVVSNDWGVLRLPNGSTNWTAAGTGLPMVEITDLKISAGRLYAATHGRSIWYMQLH